MFPEKCIFLLFSPFYSILYNRTRYLRFNPERKHIYVHMFKVFLDKGKRSQGRVQYSSLYSTYVRRTVMCIAQVIKKNIIFFFFKLTEVQIIICHFLSKTIFSRGQRAPRKPHLSWSCDGAALLEANPHSRLRAMDEGTLKTPIP